MGLALVVCDAIIEDKTTGKKTLVGLFDRVQTARFPCVHPEMAVFVSITGGRGEYPCEIVCKHVDDETVAFSAKGKIVLRDPRHVVDLVFRLKGVRFPKPDAYWLHFLVDGIPIMMRQMLVQEQKATPRKGPEPDAN
jgi:hypothetical protein